MAITCLQIVRFTRLISLFLSLKKRENSISWRSRKIVKFLIKSIWMVPLMPEWRESGFFLWVDWCSEIDASHLECPLSSGMEAVEFQRQQNVKSNAIRILLIIIDSNYSNHSNWRMPISNDLRGKVRRPAKLAFEIVFFNQMKSTCFGAREALQITRSEIAKIQDGNGEPWVASRTKCVHRGWRNAVYDWWWVACSFRNGVRTVQGIQSVSRTPFNWNDSNAFRSHQNSPERLPTRESLAIVRYS